MQKKTGLPILTNILYGLLVLIPIAVIFLLVSKFTAFLEKIAAPLGLDTFFLTALAVVATIVLILLVSFVTGFIVSVLISFEKFENSVLTRIPGYEIVSNVVRGAFNKETAYQSALVQLYGPGTGVFAFIMEEHENGLVTVFVPSSPALTLGVVHIVKKELITLLDASAADMSNCISSWGTGSDKLVGTLPGQNSIDSFSVRQKKAP